MTTLKQTPKTYLLTGIIDGKTINFKQKFASRSNAMDYMFHLYEKRYKLNTQVEDVFPISKHNIEYVIDFHNRFRIARNA